MKTNIRNLFENEKKRRSANYKELWKIVHQENSDKRKQGVSFKDRSDELLNSQNVLKRLYNDLQKVYYDPNAEKLFKNIEINESFMTEHFYEFSTGGLDNKS